jgi:hypothetical protein
VCTRAHTVFELRNSYEKCIFTSELEVYLFSQEYILNYVVSHVYYQCYIQMNAIILYRNIGVSLDSRLFAVCIKFFVSNSGTAGEFT